MSIYNRQLVERLMSGLNADNSAVIDDIYTEDAEIEWPQFGVKIIGSEDRRRAFDSLPVKPDVHPRRVFGEGNTWIVESVFSYENQDFNTIAVLEFQGGKVIRETTYWALPKTGKAGWQEEVYPSQVKRFVHPLDAVVRVPEPEELEE